MIWDFIKILINQVGPKYLQFVSVISDIPKHSLCSCVPDTKFDSNTCSLNGSDPLKPKCPVLNSDNSPAFPDWLTIIMLCVYLLFANILLLNLLIAIFK